MKILFIEDDSSFGYILKEYLGLKGFSVHWFKNGQDGLKALEKEGFDLCILDIMLPGESGFEIASMLQKDWPEMPFIFLSARNLKVDKLKGYRLGCDDYITKPVDEELLVAKIEAITQRSQAGRQPSGQSTFSLGAFTFEADNQKLLHSSGERILTTRETGVLLKLATQAGSLVDRKEILNEIWGSSDEFSRKSMDVFISRLRKYLRADDRIRIRNVHGKGFILEIED